MFVFVSISTFKLLRTHVNHKTFGNYFFIYLLFFSESTQIKRCVAILANLLLLPLERANGRRKKRRLLHAWKMGISCSNLFLCHCMNVCPGMLLILEWYVYCFINHSRIVFLSGWVKMFSLISTENQAVSVIIYFGYDMNER